MGKVEQYQKVAISLIVIGGFLIIITTLIFLSKTTALKLGFPIDTSIFGNYGDVVGGVVGALWSLAGVLLFYAALKLQREDLNLQRQELVKSREIAQEQSKTFHVQRFENTFFNLLDLHHEIVKGIDIRKNKTEIVAQGRDCFKYIYNDDLRGHVAVRKVPNDDIDGIISVYLNTYERNQSDLGHYFRNLYHIFKYIHFSDVSFPEKHRYANFARAQLSSFELLLLFYNCLSRNGVEKFKPLIETYQVLKNMPLEKLVHPSHKNQYADTAFIKT